MGFIKEIREEVMSRAGLMDPWETTRRKRTVENVRVILEANPHYVPLLYEYVPQDPKAIVSLIAHTYPLILTKVGEQAYGLFPKLPCTRAAIKDLPNYYSHPYFFIIESSPNIAEVMADLALEQRNKTYNYNSSGCSAQNYVTLAGAGMLKNENPRIPLSRVYTEAQIEGFRGRSRV